MKLMRFARVLLVLTLAAAGCGDNTGADSPTTKQAGATSAVGGSQVSHSKSFMLVTSVASGHSQIAKSKDFVNKPGVGGGR
ncbi:MAG TPA: hypothetical protein VGM90_40170 [Kofleriaceae bacterium]|jgi:hypothetical protein